MTETKKSDNKRNFPFERLPEGLKLARESRGKSRKECSQILDIPSNKLKNYEEGKYIPSLPEIESLSYFYNVPLPALFNPDLLPAYSHDPDANQFKQLLDIRLHVIAARLQLAREKSGKSYRELSKETAISSSRLKKYENGDTGVPLDDLEKIAAALEVEFSEFTDKESPIGLWQESLSKMHAFNQLPQEIQSFILDNQNQSFIDLTRNLQRIGLDDLTKFSDLIQQIVKSNSLQN